MQNKVIKTTLDFLHQPFKREAGLDVLALSVVLRRGVLGMSQPLAKIGVSGNEQETCAFSSFGDWEPRFWNGRR